MSWKSTIQITKEEALAIIRQELERYDKDDLTTEELEALADITDIVVTKNFTSPYYWNNFDIRD